MVNVVFWGTPEFAVPALDVLHDNFVVKAVYTRPDITAGRGRKLTQSAVKKAALLKGLDVRTPTSLKGSDIEEELKRDGAEVFVVVAYGKILPKSVLDCPRRGVLNLHPSLLPKHRGPSPISESILSGDTTTGVTVMMLDVGMDTGPILKQLEEPISREDTTGSLGKRLSFLGARLMKETLPKWVKGEIKPMPQDEEKATYCSMIKKVDGEIDWADSAENIDRKVRAYSPWPGAHTFWRGARITLTQVVKVIGEKGPPGTITELKVEGGTNMIRIATGRDSLVISRLKPEGKTDMDSRDFVRGRPGFTGATLPS